MELSSSPVARAVSDPSALAKSLGEPFGAILDVILARVPSHLARPTWGIICGSGLSGLASKLQEKVEVPYSDLPGFPRSTVAGHGSALAFGFLEDDERPRPPPSLPTRRIPVVAAMGRFHTYEGNSPRDCILPTRVMRCMGIKALLITNACGSLNPEWEVGTIATLHDHLSLPTLGSMNPLVGPNLDALGPRFPSTSDAYDPSLRLGFCRAAHSLGLLDNVRSGTYAYVVGPTYESRAESRCLWTLGADCVGMSTVPEVMAARHAGVKVLALSLITNKVVVTPYFDAKQAVLSELDAGLGQAAPAAGGAVAAAPAAEASVDAVANSNEVERQRDAAELQAERDRLEAANHEEVLEVGRRRAEDMRRLVARTICTVHV